MSIFISIFILFTSAIVSPSLTGAWLGLGWAVTIRQQESMNHKLIIAVVILAVAVQAWPAPRASNSLADKIAALSKVDEDFEGMF